MSRVQSAAGETRDRIVSRRRTRKASLRASFPAEGEAYGVNEGLTDRVKANGSTEGAPSDDWQVAAFDFRQTLHRFFASQNARRSAK